MTPKEAKKIEEMHLAVFSKNRSKSLAALAGLLSSSRQDFIQSIGRVAQGAMQYNFWETLLEELKRFEKAGSLKPRLDKPKSKQAILKMHEYLNSGVPEEEILQALKNIYWIIIDSGTSLDDELRAYTFLDICKKLEAVDLLVLFSCFKRMDSAHGLNDTHGYQEWVRIVAEDLSLPAEVILIREEELMTKKLITDRRHPDRSGITSPQTFRLTGLGIQLCEFIKRGNIAEISTREK